MRVLLVAVGLLAAASPVWALDLTQQYEEEFVSWALRESRLEIEPEPHGKTIERIEIVRENVIARSDPWPDWFNLFHMKSRDHVVRRELLVRPGDVWDAARVEESARNLRALLSFAVVRTVACKGNRPEHVILLVVTKDLWSIRLNTAFSAVGSILHVLDFQPAEQNFLGRGKIVSIHLRLQQLDLGDVSVRDKLVLGETYIDPRLFGTRLRLEQAFDALVAGQVPCGGQGAGGQSWCSAKKAGDFDGATAWLRLERPLYSLATEWGFGLWGSVNQRQVRRFVVNSSEAVPPGERAGLSLDTMTFDPDTVPEAERRYVPRVYDARELATQASVTRSLGLRFKHDLTAGLGVYRNRYTAPGNFPFDEETVRRYELEWLPRSEDAAYVALGYHLHGTRYLKLRNIQGFALTEDFLLGPDTSIAANFALNTEDTRQSFIEAQAAVQYQWYLRDDLFAPYVRANARWQPNLAELGLQGPWANKLLEVGVRNATPMWGVGRLHTRARLLVRRNDLDHNLSVLGGDSGLRGYASNAFEGQNLVQANVEYRTRPINFYTLHLGLIGFYDGGAVFGGQDPRDSDATLRFHYHHSVGLGVRGQFPQFDKGAVRVDFGVPLDGEGGAVGTWFSFAFLQVF
jgi:hypothetical protein